MEEKPNIQKQLRDAQEQREKLLDQLKESESIIASIETRLAEVTKSQEARLRADDRVDNKLLEQHQGKKNREDTPPSGTAVSGEKKKERKEKTTSQHPIITDDSSWYEIVIQEDGSKRERLRKK